MSTPEETKAPTSVRIKLEASRTWHVTPTLGLVPVRVELRTERYRTTGSVEVPWVVVRNVVDAHGSKLVGYLEDLQLFRYHGATAAEAWDKLLAAQGWVATTEEGREEEPLGTEGDPLVPLRNLVKRFEETAAERSLSAASTFAENPARASELAAEGNAFMRARGMLQDSLRYAEDLLGQRKVRRWW